MRDTLLEVERMQLDLLRKAGGTKRLALMHSLTDTVRALSRSGIKHAHPEWSQRKQDMFFLKLQYGSGLAFRVEQYFEALEQ